MAIERKWLAVQATAFTADGTALGVVTVADTAGLKVKQFVVLKATTKPELSLQVKRVLSPTQLIVGPPDNKIAPNIFTDISAYTLALGANISAAEQNKSNIPIDDHRTAVYEGDPTVADRVIQVDQYGRFYDANNPMPIIFDGTIEVGSVEVVGENGNTIEPNTDGSINVNVVSAPIAGQEEKSIYNEALAVASGATTTLVTYTVPFAKTAILHRVTVSGTNIARYDVLINGTPIDTKRTNFGDNLNESFEYVVDGHGLPLISGDAVTVKVLHNRPYIGDFEGRIQILEIV